MDRGAWRVTVHGVVKSRAQLRNQTKTIILYSSLLSACKCLLYTHTHVSGLPQWLSGKEFTSMRVIAGTMGSILALGRKWQPTRVLLPGKAYGQRRLEGCSQWGCKRVGHDLATKQQQKCHICII